MDDTRIPVPNSNSDAPDQVNQPESEDSLLAGDEISRLAQSYVDYQGKKPIDDSLDETSKLEKEIFADLGIDEHEEKGDAATPFSSESSASEKEQKPSDFSPAEPSFYQEMSGGNRVESLDVTPTAGGVDQSSHHEASSGVDELEASIAQDLGTTPSLAETMAASSSSDLGVGKTYYGDLSQAMSSDEPATISELIKRAAFEKKEKAVLSPTSRENLFYIGGAVLLMLISVATWFFVFKGNSDDVSFITEERVSSLVYADEDIGINMTGVEAFQLKAAIRKVLKRDYSVGSASQIYYVEEDELGRLRRVGIKDVFDTTEAQVPELLYDNIENNFMQGVYTTDQNYPFIILKTLSYDRAFEGMKEWEPTMVDDLATFFNLPAEATDRSLLTDGFEDDLINNKNVRVVRYIPRESDRKGILEILGLQDSPSEDTTTEPETNGQSGIFDETETLTPESDSPFGTIETVGSIQEKIIAFLTQPFMTKRAYAQTTGIGGTYISDTMNTGSATTTVCYKATTVCIDLKTGNKLPSTSTPSDTVFCYKDLLDPDNPGRTYTQEEIVGHESEYICKNILTGGEVIEGGQAIDYTTTLYTKPVCFEVSTGNRITENTTNASVDPYQLCYLPYQCRRVACFQGNVEVSSDNEGRPGVSCRTTDEIVEPGDAVRKSCIQFTELLNLRNINNMNLCFDEYGRMVQVDERIQTLEDFYVSDARTSEQSVNNLIETSAGLTCVVPTNRYERMCMAVPYGSTEPVVIDGMLDGEPLEGGSSLPDGTTILYCFEPNPIEDLGAMFRGGLNQDIREFALQISQELRSISTLVGVLGGVSSIFGENDINTFLVKARAELEDIADFFWQVATADLFSIGNDYGSLSYQEPTVWQKMLGQTAYAQNSDGTYGNIIYEIAANARRLEDLLNQIKQYFPSAEDTVVVQRLRTVIDVIKEIVGMNHNAAWGTVGNLLPTGVDIYPGDPLSSGPQMEAVQQALVLLGLMDPLSTTGELDLVTQQAISALQNANGIGQGLSVDQVYLSAETLSILQQMVGGSSSLYGGTTEATINDFFSESPALGTYSEQVQMLQIILYAQGYDISIFNGIFDQEVCSALQDYQRDHDLEVADSDTCEVSPETIESLNSLIREKNYLGSGYAISANGSLEGSGQFLGTYGPGVVDFSVGEAEAKGLREGDVILMYTFLDEDTILITTHESVITEIIRRRALSDIFTK